MFAVAPPLPWVLVQRVQNAFCHLRGQLHATIRSQMHVGLILPIHPRVLVGLSEGMEVIDGDFIVLHGFSWRPHCKPQCLFHTCEDCLSVPMLYCLNKLGMRSMKYLDDFA